MNKWFFQVLSPAQVETEITQRDQFSNDNVTLNETIVRETIQNSLDAYEESTKQVKVTFRWLDKTNGLKQDYFKSLLEEQTIHAQAAGIDLKEIDFSSPRALVIEDFGTKGLTGEIKTKDNQNFSDFWRRHGKSHKSGKSRGRWGLGKLVYSTTSQLGVFFGLTVRSGDPTPHLMGQSVLNLYELGGKQYLPHSFFADQSHPNDIYQNIPVPIVSRQLVSEFQEQFQLDRTSQSGLSIVIPFPNATFDQRSMIRVSIENYFYPIVTGQLCLVFDDIEINKGNIRELAHLYAEKMYPDIDILFDFLEEISDYPESELLTLKPSWSNDKHLGENDFEDEELNTLKNSFSEGKICAIRLPISLKSKGIQGRKDITTHITTFIKRPDEITQGLDLYVRGGLTLPGEQKFRSRRALGAMVAEDEPVCDFLGDAENPAHTLWNLATEKLGKKYVSPRDTVRVIKYALINLYDLLAEVKEEKDDTALSNFFAMDEDLSTNPIKKPKKSQTKGVKVTPSKPEVPKLQRKLIQVNETPEGFAISTLQNCDESLFPAKYKVTIAYDDGSSNPFKNYRPTDFSLSKGGFIKTKIFHQGIQKISRPNRIEEKSKNTFIISIEKPPFLLELTGFDKYRDLKVLPKKIKIDSSINEELEVES